MGEMSKINKTSQKVILRSNGTVRVVTENTLPHKTDQSFKDQQNVNNIMKKYRAVGIDYKHMPNAVRGVYGDFTNVKDYRSAVQASIDVQNAFMKLPSDVRKRFQNDPQELAEFLKDSKNHEEAKKLGLLHDVIVPEKELDVLKGIRTALDKRDDELNDDAKNQSKGSKKTPRE